MKNDNPEAQKERFRDGLIAAISCKVNYDLEEVVSTLPPEVSEDVRGILRQDLTLNSNFLLGRMSFERLQDETAVEKHLAMVLRSARHLVFRITEQWKRE